MAHGVSAKSRLQAVEIAFVSPIYARVLVTLTSCSYRFREQQEKIARLKDETVREIIKHSTEIVEMKEAVARQLKYVQDVVEANK